MSIEATTNNEVKESDENLQTLSSTDETTVNDSQPTTESDLSEANTAKTSPSTPIDIKQNGAITDKNNDYIPSPFTSSIKLEQIIDNEQPITKKDASTDNSIEHFYDFCPENFHAEQVRPSFATK